ncbi:MAG: hypothetical protein GWM92_12720, partial [Gemmatimonadetes bacterium]|nr:hypothetical protein [Gemmatimonadota bacterium]NIR79561.1 hypothetical protein [Gemmatimonadota bacterium]NIT88242.1 hypothetical protein [Gemmatimonadota bacterium]NIU32048.1 hypothetical protein [Gemmatimonadota bacterium]NIU36657.1 hypothetical protein [Gemmatimonadota bacterium]
MKIRHAVVLGLAAALLAACDDGGDEIRFRETAPSMEEAGAPPRDTTPPTAEEISADEAEGPAAEEEWSQRDAGAAAEEGGEPGTVSARFLGETVYSVQIGAFSRDAAASDLVARVEAEGL